MAMLHHCSNRCKAGNASAGSSDSVLEKGVPSPRLDLFGFNQVRKASAGFNQVRKASAGMMAQSNSVLEKGVASSPTSAVLDLFAATPRIILELLIEVDPASLIKK
ncbi:hypothetical protein QQ045_021007 [Rhodiola kirilowii]